MLGSLFACVCFLRVCFVSHVPTPAGPALEDKQHWGRAEGGPAQGGGARPWRADNRLPCSEPMAESSGKASYILSHVCVCVCMTDSVLTPLHCPSMLVTVLLSPAWGRRAGRAARGPLCLGGRGAGAWGGRASSEQRAGLCSNCPWTFPSRLHDVHSYHLPRHLLGRTVDGKCEHRGEGVAPCRRVPPLSGIE